ncbi:cytochrome c oxidase subunit II [Sphingomonas sp. ASV193]|uniref:cytochrome c oxidase subunit II n=1 Tax=Sphingomonas sp. ASV193 TaxID=3144405 RepID=UPI0032E8B73F
MTLIGRALALLTTATTASAAFAQNTAQAAANATAPAANAAAPAAAAPAAAAAPPVDYLTPTPGVGMPDGRYGLQDQVTALGQRVANFHNGPLLWMCAVISVFVLVLLVYTIFRFRRGANPTPSKTTHHTMIEVVWTLVPVLILVAIAIPSIRIIRAQYSPPPVDLTIKVVGHQWYWTYQYPDNGGFELTSNQLKEANDPTRGKTDRARTDKDGPPMLAVDERLVIPAGKTVKFLVTAEDVIHSFAVPAFYTKMDAVPGRINETWVKVDRPGVYFGQCSELCGVRHGYMPIAVEVLPEAQFNEWLASKGGQPKGAKPAAPAPAAPAVIPAAAPAPAAPAPAAAPAKA